MTTPGACGTGCCIPSRPSIVSFLARPTNSGHGAARAFAEGQQTDIPLLYIHGGFGFGKPIFSTPRRWNSGSGASAPCSSGPRISCATFLGALYRKDTLALQEELRTAEVLIIDDLQHICRSTATASEFLYTVNAFADLRRRVVIAADRTPTPWKAWAPTSKSRLAGGLCIVLDKAGPGHHAWPSSGPGRRNFAATSRKLSCQRWCWNASPTWTTPVPAN